MKTPIDLTQEYIDFVVSHTLPPDVKKTPTNKNLVIKGDDFINLFADTLNFAAHCVYHGGDTGLLEAIRKKWPEAVTDGWPEASKTVLQELKVIEHPVRMPVKREPALVAVKRKPARVAAMA